MKEMMLVIGVLLVRSVSFADKEPNTFTGQIMDKQCAQMQSHDNMMKAEGAKSAKECTLACIKNGDSFVLFDSATKKVYPIDSAKKVTQYAGEQVKITGDYDSGADMLHVKTVAPTH
jgi:hypothetical protein